MFSAPQPLLCPLSSSSPMPFCLPPLLPSLTCFILHTRISPISYLLFAGNAVRRPVALCYTASICVSARQAAGAQVRRDAGTNLHRLMTSPSGIRPAGGPPPPGLNIPGAALYAGTVPVPYAARDKRGYAACAHAHRCARAGNGVAGINTLDFVGRARAPRAGRRIFSGAVVWRQISGA